MHIILNKLYDKLILTPDRKKKLSFTVANNCVFNRALNNISLYKVSYYSE